MNIRYSRLKTQKSTSTEVLFLFSDDLFLGISLFYCSTRL
ncbi:hypothetical protein MCC93_18150 [Morococcus cerebrosus]|uniref:Uncharacterized protein n=1 Tax=Morococcus cerebrosus TaxID=1056807 RepID=A0A0C1GMX0_9NEIS|nr:hypothetical protein MCC93_18150 [Morococcus cerebrosus]